MAEPNPSNVAPWYLRNINQALALDDQTGEVYIRTGINGNVVITGNVTIPGNIQTQITSVGNSGPLNVPYLPVSGNVVVTSGNVNALVSGNVNANVSGNVVVSSGNVNANVSGTVSISSGTINANVSGNIVVSSGNVNANVSGTITAVQGNAPWTTNFGDSAYISAFSRQRISVNNLLGEFRNMYGTTGNVELLYHFVGSGSATPVLNKDYTLLNVTTNSGDVAVRQTRQYHPYIPGTSQLGLISFTLGQITPGCQQSVGMFDDNNGIFFRMNGTTPEFVIRKGGVDTEVIPQNLWNVDTFLTTSGPSKTIIDFTKSQLLVIDYQWLAVGRVRVGFDIDGQIFYANYFQHANVSTEPYMFQPSLPVRWEVKNVTQTVNPVSLMSICCGVYGEGQLSETGFTNSISNGVTPITITNGTPTGLLAVRLKNTVNGKPMQAFARLKDWNIFSSVDIRYKIMILQSSSNITGTPTWTSVSPTGWCEYTTNFTLTSDTPTNSLILFDGYAAGGSGNNSGASLISSPINRTSVIYQNYDSTDSMIFVIMAYKLQNNASVYSNFTWLEVK